MAIRDIFKVSRKTFVNPSGWLDFDWIKLQNRTIWDVLKVIFTVPKPAQTETFAEAMERLDLTEEDVQLTARKYRQYALVFLMFAIAAFVYAFYLLFTHGTFIGWLLGMAVTGLFLVQAFKYDFWSFQMRRRQLGTTFLEWRRHILGEKGPST